MAKNYIEVRVVPLVDSGELLASLSDSGTLGAWESDGVTYLYWPEELWTRRAQEELEEAVQRLGSPADKPKIIAAVVANQNWNDRWAQSIRPVFIGQRILVRQSWNPAVPPSGGIELIIDPKQAFGTGYHATTQLLAEWLEDRVHGGEQVLDVGTGSGILAMVALRLGARLALGIDNDPVAIECARENAIVNGFGPELKFRGGSIEALRGEMFDIIVANLDRNALLASAGVLMLNLSFGGSLLASGLQLEDCPDLEEVVKAAGGEVVDRRTRDEWLAIEVSCRR